MVNYNLKASFVDEQSEILKSFTKTESDGLAKKHLNIEDMIIIVVGDKDAIMDDVQSLGYPVVELDTDGNPVK